MSHGDPDNLTAPDSHNMSNTRPNFIDLRSTSQASVSRSLRSPRLHVAGEAPPELSPLDAFALQSRLLARQLSEESSKGGRRMSRLPPLTTESPLIVQGRSDYFRSMSQDSGSDYDESPSQHHTGLGLRTEVEESPLERPRSMHPRMSRIPPTPDESIPVPKRPLEEAPRGRQLSDADRNESYFGARRELSPVNLDRVTSASSDRGLGLLSRSTTQDSQLSLPSPQQYHSLGSSPDKALRKDSFDATGLVPPRPLFPKRSSSIMSAPLQSTDEESINMLGASFHSQPGKLSSSGGMISPGLGSFAHHYQRSPSISSEASGLPRPSFNFSRPMTRSGTPGLDSPARQPSSDSQASFIFADDTANTPVSMNSEGFPDSLPDEGKPAASSYIYSKFSLPRGKALQRSTPQFPENQPVAAYQWEQPPIVPPSNVQTFPIGGQPPPSPPTRPSSSAGPRFFEEPIPRPSLERSKLSMEVVRSGQQPSPDPSRPSTEGGRASEDVPRGRPLISPLHDAARGKTPMSTTTSDSASTIKAARSQYSQTTSISDMTAEEHVTKAVALHENGSLNESTYHLRHAARQGHPTGMLLYALACRHGWGMRPNQREGVEWLRKAAESAGLEIADDEDQVKGGKNVDVVERKTRKAQFALSIYELGVSHMNGWGVEQDKALALRCFEIAGCKNSRSERVFVVLTANNQNCSLG